MILNKLFLVLVLAVLFLQQGTFAKQLCRKSEANIPCNDGKGILKTIGVKISETDNCELKISECFDPVKARALWIDVFFETCQDNIRRIAKLFTSDKSASVISEESNPMLLLTLNENDCMKTESKNGKRSLKIVLTVNDTMAVYYDRGISIIEKIELSAKCFNEWELELVNNTSYLSAKAKLNCIQSGLYFLKLYDISELDHMAFQSTELCGSGKILGIGIVNKTSHDFTLQIIICFDPVTHKTFWAKHFLGHTTKSPSLRSSYWYDQFIGFDLKADYKKLKNTDKGHLAPYADFNDKIQKMATNYLINSAPQASRLNKGHWYHHVERPIRDLANNQNDPVLVVTGSWGSKPSIVVDTQYAYPYPEEFFKIVVLSSGTTQVYVGVNDDSNPPVSHYTQVTPQMRNKWQLKVTDTNYADAKAQFDRIHP